MPKYTVTAPDGTRWNVNAPEGASQDEVIAYAKTQWSAKADETPVSEPVGSRLDRELASIPRQLGLTARAGIEGPMEMLGILSNPIAYGLSKLTGQQVMPAGEFGGYLADKLGLPSPETPTERVVGQGAKMLTGIGGQAALASRAAPAVSGVSEKVLSSLAANPTSQLTGAAGGGTAGQYIKEEGGGPAAQFVGALAGGFGGAAVPAITSKVVNGVKSLANAVTGTKASIDNISANLDRILQSSGISSKDISRSTRNQILAELKKASDTGNPVDENVIRRLADFDMVPGTTPTRGAVTLDPVQITQEKNLAKIAANSQDERLNQLARIPRQNDIALTQNLNEMGASRAVDAPLAGASIKGAMLQRDIPRKAAVDRAYEAVRNAEGRYANIDVPTFSKLANDALDEKALGSVLPAEARGLLNDISSGKIPLNVNTMMQVDSVLSGLARTAGKGTPQSLAVGQIRKALFDAPIESTSGEKAVQLYDKARKLAALRFQKIEQNPAMQAALDDAAPDKFVQTFILGGGSKANIRDVQALVRDLKSQPDVLQAAKDQIVAHLKSKALSGNADEVGNFSPSAYNKAMRDIGDRKLAMFFKPDELKQLKAVGRVASYTKFQPTGSAVNNSNTASAFAGLLERVAGNPLVSRLPLGGPMVGEPLQNWANQINARAALNPVGGLLQPQPKSLLELQPGLSLMLPALLGTE